MRLGDLLVRARLATEPDVTRAIEYGKKHGGLLGENLVSLGVLTEVALKTFIHKIPGEPIDLASTHIDENDLLSLLIKLIYIDRLNTIREYVEAIKLPLQLVTELATMAVDRRLISALGTRQSDSLLDMSYAFTDEGRRFAVDCLERSGYVGPAPITIEEFNDQVTMQKPTNERISMERIRNSMGEITIDISLVEQAGPALNSGRAILLYGPPGNGKTTVALTFANVFHDVIYIPYAITIEGQIIRYFDPSIHVPLTPVELAAEEEISFVRLDAYDRRWVACRRPFVIVGGELTLEMLDLRYDPTGHFYEAPLHMKALGGCFFIDDFGRQLVSPRNLLNRWIVPLEDRVDYLNLHTGKSFSIPFEELVIFSTNLEPEDLMDPAFLRRLPYKIEVGSPSPEIYRKIFENECAKHHLELSDDTFNIICYKVVKEKNLDLAAFQPRFIVDQVVAACRFIGIKPHFEPRFIEYALNNLKVHRISPSAPTAAITGH